MNVRDLVKNAPSWVVWICGTVIGMSIIASFTLLSVTGSNADDLVRFLNTGFNLLGLLLGGGAWLSASSANDAAHALKEQITSENQDTQSQVQEGNTVGAATH